MPLLQNNTLPQEESQQEIPEGQPSPEESQSGEFDSAAIEESVMGELEGKAASDVKRVVDAGTKLLFSKEGGFQVFEEIREEVPLEDELGTAAANMMLILLDKSGNTMPGEAVGPAGIILLARACEFINQQGIAEVTYDIFAEAAKLFTHVIASKLGGEGEEGEEEMPAEEMPQQPTQQPGSPLLQQGGV